MNRDSANLAVDDLALTCVEAGADLKAELTDSVADRTGGVDRARRPVKTREEAVAGGVNLLARGYVRGARLGGG